MRRLIAAALLAATVSACSGSADEVTTGATSQATSPVGTALTSPTSSPTAAGASDQSTSRQFCDAFIAAAGQVKPPIDPLDTSSQASAEEAQQWSDYQAAVQRLTDMAPADVHEDMAAFNELIQRAGSASALGDQTKEPYKAITDRLGIWLTSNCKE